MEFLLVSIFTRLIVQLKAHAHTSTDHPVPLAPSQPGAMGLTRRYHDASIPNLFSHRQNYAPAPSLPLNTRDTIAAAEEECAIIRAILRERSQVGSSSGLKRERSSSDHSESGNCPKRRGDVTRSSHDGYSGGQTQGLPNSEHASESEHFQSDAHPQERAPSPSAEEEQISEQNSARHSPLLPEEALDHLYAKFASYLYLAVPPTVDPKIFEKRA